MQVTKSELAALSYTDLKAAVDKAGGQRSFARLHQIPRTTVQDMLERARIAMFKHRPPPAARVERVKRGEAVRRFILSSAQDSTKLHEGFLTNLEAYRDYLAAEGPCEIMIAGFTYNKSLFEDHSKHKIFWADRILPYIVTERVRLGEMVDFCGEYQANPTAVSPMSGFETYTRHRWGIFPHAKVQLQSVPTMKHSPAKQIMTTGACTLPNYVPKRAGIKASFHHVIGAVIVEVLASGEFFCRHLLAEEDGSFYDLDRRIEAGDVTVGHRIEALNPGDIHVAQIDPVVSQAIWGFYPQGEGAHRRWVYGPVEGTMIDRLRPRYQFYHDLTDFKNRNSHNLKDPHHMFALYVEDSESVEDEMRESAMFASEADARAKQVSDGDCESVMVEANHNDQLVRWLKTADYRLDPKNARFFLQCQLATYEAIEAKDRSFSIYEAVMRTSFAEEGYDCAGVTFLKVDESFKVLGIEKGMHGHLGANGARGNPRAFTRMGSKATTGHTHSCSIFDGIYTAGTTSLLDMGYNLGLSSWSHSHVITYPNGKRTIITMQGARWAA